ESRDESLKALRVEASGAAPNQLQRQGIDPRQAGELVGRDPWKPTEERRREVMMNVAQRRQHDVEIVEQPLGRGRRRLSAFGVVDERGIDLSKRERVLTKFLQVGRAAAALAERHSEQRGQAPRMFLERLDPEQLYPTGRWTILAHLTHELLCLVRASVLSSVLLMCDGNPELWFEAAPISGRRQPSRRYRRHHMDPCCRRSARNRQTIG